MRACSVSLPRSAINLRCSVQVLHIDRVCIQVGTSLASPILSDSVLWPFIQLWMSNDTHIVAPWDPLKTRDGVREAAELSCPNPNMLGTLSYCHRVSPRFKKEVRTSALK